MNDLAILQQVITHYNLTLEYVGYKTLPFLPGWSHYEAMKLADPGLFAHHLKEYERFAQLEEEKRKHQEHVGCKLDEPCLYVDYICHCSYGAQRYYGSGLYDPIPRNGAHTHK